ncbi:MAG TPA: class I tRNA ligase family protein, partial [bacterium]
LDGLVRRVNRAFEEYVYNDAASALYQFTWHEFCDWYLEIAKPRLGAEGPAGDAARGTAVHVLRRVLALLHPIMPFVTEEIAARLPGGGALLATSRFPEPEDARVDAAAEAELALVVEVVDAVRNIRGEMNVSPKVAVAIVLEGLAAEPAAIVGREEAVIRRLANAREVRVNAGGDPGESATAALSCGVLRVPLAGVVDFGAELARLDKEIGALDADAAKLEAKLANGNFVSRAPAEKVAEVRERLEKLREKRGVLAASRERVLPLARGGQG